MDDDEGFLHRIVVGADGSDGSMRGMEWAALLARSCGAEVLAVNVLTYNREFLRDLLPDTVTNWRRALERDLRGGWAAPLAERGVAHRCLVVEGDSPAAGLVEAAEKAEADLIVVGANGHSTTVGRVLGSTSYTLTHHAHQPVIVVPATWSRPVPG